VFPAREELQHALRHSRTTSLTFDVHVKRHVHGARCERHFRSQERFVGREAAGRHPAVVDHAVAGQLEAARALGAVVEQRGVGRLRRSIAGVRTARIEGDFAFLHMSRHTEV